MTTVIDIVDNQRVKYRPVHNMLAAEQCGAWWGNELVVATKVETKIEYKIC